MTKKTTSAATNKKSVNAVVFGYYELKKEKRKKKLSTISCHVKRTRIGPLKMWQNG